MSIVKKLALALLVVAASWMAAASQAEAGPPWSPRNPYQHYNIHGINYGSMQWERAHGQSRSSNVRRGIFRFRRWR